MCPDNGGEYVSPGAFYGFREKEERKSDLETKLSRRSKPRQLNLRGVPRIIFLKIYQWSHYFDTIRYERKLFSIIVVYFLAKEGDFLKERNINIHF